MPRERKLPDGMKKRGKAYYAWFRKDGRQVRKKLSNDFRVACDLLNEMQARASRADFGILDNNKSIDEIRSLWVGYVAQTCRESTAKRYGENLDNILPAIGATTVAQIRPEAILRCRNDRLLEVGPRTVNMETGALSTMLRWSVAQRLIKSNPIESIKPLPNDSPKKQRRPMTVEEIERFFLNCPEYLRPAFLTLMTTGMRRGELIAMKFSDVDFERRTATIQAATAKSGKKREVPLDDATFDEVVRLRAAAEHRQPVAGKTKPGRLSRDHVFVTGANTPWANPGNLLRSFYVVCKRAGIEDGKRNGSVDVHSIRGTFVSLAIENGGSPKAVQEIIGHASLAMTMCVYAKAADHAKRQAVAALPFASTTESRDVIPMERRA